MIGIIPKNRVACLCVKIKIVIVIEIISIRYEKEKLYHVERLIRRYREFKGPHSVVYYK